MAVFKLREGQLVVELSVLERLGSCAWRDVCMPSAAVRRIRAVGDAWREVRGIRAPGTGLPGVIMLGTTRWFAGGGTDFCAVYGHRPGVVVEGDVDNGSAWCRFVVTADAAERVAAELNAAVGLQGQG